MDDGDLDDRDADEAEPENGSNLDEIGRLT
jgi:hypothetical protein